MKCNYSCRTDEHVLARRTFLGSTLGGLGAAASFGGFVGAAPAEELAKQQKHILCIYMAGGLSQLESWDPKPKTDTGGPFRAIPTSVPGIEICELLPKTAMQMQHLALVRGVNTNENDHGKGQYMMLKGRREMPGFDYPTLGAVAAKALSSDENPLPGHIHISPGGGGLSNDSAYLGPKYSSIVLGNGQPPQNTARPDSVSDAADARRNALRGTLNDRFALRRRTAVTDAYTYSFDQAAQLMQRRELFDVTREPAGDQERYGSHDFGRHCLLARRLLEAGVTYVQVSHSNYDTHNENFDFHLEQLAEFDVSFAALLADLADRGMLDHTLIVVMSEFGRTPNINQYYGRDHWGTAWSVALGGCGVKRGTVIGKTNENGTAVADRQVDAGHLFHTYLRAVGLDTSTQFDIGGRPMPIADPAFEAIPEVLA